jgi:YD repeat-containing protein
MTNLARFGTISIRQLYRDTKILPIYLGFVIIPTLSYHAKPYPYIWTVILRLTTFIRRKMKRLIVILVYLLLTNWCIYAQTGGTQPLKQVNFATPEAAMLGKFENISISNYTGVPDISIPLYTIKEREFELPIVLRYHSSGIKVDEEATWVGLGWDLSVGGQIIQVPVGANDDYDHIASTNISQGYNNLMNPSPTPFPSNHHNYDARPERGSVWSASGSTPGQNDDDYLTFWWVSQKQLLKPDIYNYSLPTASGKFFLNPQTQKPVLFGAINSKDSITRKTTNAFTSGWIISDMNGYIYTFKESGKEYTSSGDIQTGFETSSAIWRLSSIVFPWGKDLKFFYSDGVSIKTSQSDDFTNGSTAMNSPYYLHRIPNSITNYSKYLSSIESENVQIVFESSADRIDLCSGDQNKLPEKLAFIHIIDKISGDTIKSFGFNYDYFESNHNEQDEVNDYKRLKLLSVREISHNNSEITLSNPPYSFEYNQTNLPVKSSMAVDHWGYYNGQNSNATFLPDLSPYAFSGLIEDFVNYEQPVQQFISDANVPYNSGNINKAKRGMNADYAKAAILQKITYPTGGYRVLNYEPNDFSNKTVFSSNEEVSGNFLYTNVTVSDNNYVPGTGCIVSPSVSDTLYPDNRGYLELYDLNVQIIRYNSIVTYQDILGSYVKIVKVGPTGLEEDIKVWDLAGKEAEYNNNGGVEWTQCYFKYEGNISDKYYIKANLVNNTNLPIIPCNPNYQPRATSNGSFKWRDPSKSKESSIGGGLRISSQESFSHNGIQDSKITYSYTDGQGRSSGKLMSPLNYISYRNVTRKVESCYGTYPLESGQVLTYYEYTFSMSSNSYIPLSYDASGSVVGYDRVDVKEVNFNDNSNNGSVRYYYQNIGSHYINSDINAPVIPYYNNGLLDSVTYLNSSGQVVKRFLNTYLKIKDEAIYGVFIRDNYVGPDNFGLCNIPSMSGTNHFIFSPRWLVVYYPLISEMFVKSNITEIDYFPGSSKYLVNQKSMDHNSYGQLTELQETQSDGHLLIKKFKYPTTEGPLGMVSQNYLNPVIHEEHFVDSSKVFDNYIHYQSFGDLYSDSFLYIQVSPYYIPYRDSVYFPTYSTKYYSTANDYIRLNLLYDPENFQIIESDKENDIKTSYIWGFNNQYPVAKIENASLQEIQIALGGSIPDLGDGGLSTSQIYSLRSGLPNSLISIYTYKPLVGMISQTDPNGITTHYEYDSFGRLKAIKDNNGNILKQYNYHYYNQQ